MDESPNFAGSDPVVLLGLGFTTRRLARRLLLRSAPVHALVRDADRFHDLASVGLLFSGIPGIPKGAVLIHTVPPLAADENEQLRNLIVSAGPRRVIYISSTSVYGPAIQVNAESPVDPSTPKGYSRVQEENWLRSGPWQTFVVRPAAIYGPGRGVHSRIAKGEIPRGSGSGIISRIHVDDLAAILEAAAGSGTEGAWPLADDHPCSSDEISDYCASLLKIPLPRHAHGPALQTGRIVDGTAIRELLGVSLAYGSYQSGVLASLAETDGWQAGESKTDLNP